MLTPTGLFESTPAVRPENLSDTGAHLVALDETDPVSQEIFAGAMSIEVIVHRGSRRRQASRNLPTLGSVRFASERPRW